MTAGWKAGMLGRRALRLLLPLFLIFAGVAPHSLPPHSELGFLARFAPGTERPSPLRFDRPADSALFLRPAATALRKADADRREDGRTGSGDGFVAPPQHTAVPRRQGIRPAPVSLPGRPCARHFFHSRAPPFLAAA